MKKSLGLLIAALLGAAPATYADDVLTGDTRLACEAILCLSSGDRPSECASSIRRYFSIRHKKLGNTIKARRNFLKCVRVVRKVPKCRVWLMQLQMELAGVMLKS